eukprot:768782-Hanusia_phi.AAC.11
MQTALLESEESRRELDSRLWLLESRRKQVGCHGGDCLADLLARTWWSSAGCGRTTGSSRRRTSSSRQQVATKARRDSTWTRRSLPSARASKTQRPSSPAPIVRPSSSRAGCSTGRRSWRASRYYCCCCGEPSDRLPRSRTSSSRRTSPR